MSGYIGNDALTGLEGLESLHTIDQNFEVIGNDVLISIGALKSLSIVGGAINVENNQQLPYCEICQVVEQLENEPESIDLTHNHNDACTFSCSPSAFSAP